MELGLAHQAVTPGSDPTHRARLYQGCRLQCKSLQEVGRASRCRGGHGGALPVGIGAHQAINLEFHEGTDLEVVPSPDGRQLALQLWQQIWVLDAAGGEARRITNAAEPPDQHWFPRWSPDARHLVFSSMRRDAGLLVIPASGGEPRRLTSGPYDLWPSWSPDGATIAFGRLRVGGIWTIPASGGVARRLTPDALDAANPAWSPDGRWIAFSSGGRLQLISSDGASIQQLTTGPGDRMPSWSLPPPGPRLLLRNAHLLTPEPREGLWDLLLGAGTIQSVRPAGGGLAADSVIDLAGRTVIPGLIDAHAHVFGGVFSPEGSLYGGITSVGDAGSEGHEAVALSEAIASGRQDGPPIFPAGGFLVNGNMNAFPQFLRADTPEQLSRYLDHVSRLGTTQVKAYERWDRWLQAATVRAAHARGLPSLSHSLGPAVVAAGLDRKEHAFYETVTGDATLRFRQDVIEILRQARVTLTPTLVFAYVQTAKGRARHQASLSDSTVSSFVLPSLLGALTGQLDQPSPAATSWAVTPTAMQANVAAAAAAGVSLAAGTDRNDALLALHWELELWVEAGLTPLDALRTATRGAAVALGVGDRLGVIAEGAIADLVVLDAEPLSDIRNTRRIWAVVKQGQIVDREALLTQARRRQVVR